MKNLLYAVYTHVAWLDREETPLGVFFGVRGYNDTTLLLLDLTSVLSRQTAAKSWVISQVTIMFSSTCWKSPPVKLFFAAR